MIEIVRSTEFDKWLQELRDQRARAKVQARLLRLALGNPGDVKAVGQGISEMRIDYGPGYRLYFLGRGEKLIVLLCGGDKTSQQRDIESAQTIARRWKE